MKSASPDHPKMHDLADWMDAATGGAISEAGIDPLNAAIGAMERLWRWCTVYAQDGDLARFQPRRIANALGWKNDPETLLAALVEIGWLDRLDDEKLVIHDWPDHCEDSVHARLARKRIWFANGTRPSFSKLTTDEKREAKSWFDSNPQETAIFGGQRRILADFGRLPLPLPLPLPKPKSLKSVGYHSNVPPKSPPSPETESDLTVTGESDRPETPKELEAQNTCPSWSEPATWAEAERLTALIENAEHPQPVTARDSGGTSRCQYVAMALDDSGKSNVSSLSRSALISTLEILTTPGMAAKSPELHRILADLRRYPNAVYPATDRATTQPDGSRKTPSMIAKANRIIQSLATRTACDSKRMQGMKRLNPEVPT